MQMGDFKVHVGKSISFFFCAFYYQFYFGFKNIIEHICITVLLLCALLKFFLSRRKGFKVPFMPFLYTNHFDQQNMQLSFIS